MPSRSGIARFVLTVVALSTLFGWLFWTAGSSASVEAVLHRSMLAVPVISAILSARGFSWQRKAYYSLGTLALYLGVGLLAQVTGFHESAQQETGSSQPFLPFATIIYVVFMSTFPLAMLVLFVGRNPARLWSKPPE